jgi:GNAT superfamily N-acetyltransferase
MSAQALPEQLPEEWIARWRPAWRQVQEREAAAQQIMGKPGEATDFPTTFRDRPENFPAMPRRWEISRANAQTVGLVRHLVVPPYVRQAYPPTRSRSPLAGLFDLLHLHGSDTPSRSKTLETPKGTLLLRDFCPPSLVERLDIDSGMSAFARTAEREKDLLLGIARRPDCALALAHTATGDIVGEVTIAPGDAWWEGLDNVYEVAIEVSPGWRHMGVAKELLAFALELDALEDMILFAIGLSWHWDIERERLSIYRYREMLARLFGSQGFVEYPTTEPNISMEPANILLARIGKRVDQRLVGQFFSRLLSSPNLSAI